MYIFRNIYLYWIYDANNLGNMSQLNIYVGSWGMYIFRNIYLYWIYAAHILGSICQLNICVDIGYIMPTLG